MGVRRLFYANQGDEVHAFYSKAERDAFVEECCSDPTVRVITLREIKQTRRANLPGGRARFRLPSGEWVLRQIKT